MKKLILMLTFFGSFGFYVNPTLAQESVDPGEVNPYGGVCCQKLDVSCDHPSFGSFADSVWVSGAAAC